MLFWGWYVILSGAQRSEESAFGCGYAALCSHASFMKLFCNYFRRASFPGFSSLSAFMIPDPSFMVRI